MNLPDMTVEERPGKSHGLKPFTPHDSAEFKQELQDVIELVEAAKREGWPSKEIVKHFPFTVRGQLPEIMAEFGFRSWSQSTMFVKSDECIEFFTLACKWAKRKGLKTQKKWERGFIDGDGIGVYSEYSRQVKTVLEKAFDEKYFQKRVRPLVELNNMTGMDCSVQTNYVHPGHWSYPAGHGAKFFTVVKVLSELYHLDKNEYNHLLTAASTLAMARTGGGVHYPVDNMASGYLAGLTEFTKYGK